jgi:thiol-disulfide isomerase/thioredoxin
VRSDSNLTKRFDEEGVDAAQYGRMPGVLDTSKQVDGKPVLRSHSFSGNETNSLFLNLGGEKFQDISGVSGVDSLADGRAFAFFDFDRDGKSDIILTNTNNPQLQLFHNEINDAGNAVRLRLVGGSRGSQPGTVWSSRDPYGVHVLVKVNGQTIRRELRAGDGFAAQNSDTLLIGIGEATKADKVTVIWPSGKQSEIESVSTEGLTTIFENPKDGEPVFEKQVAIPLPVEKTRVLTRGQLNLPLEKDLNVIVTMTSWCPVCRGEIAHLKRLAGLVGSGVGFYGVPVDPEDDAAKLEQFQKEADPPYRIFTKISDEERKVVAELMTRIFGEQPLPSTFLTDREGRVLKSMKGTPTLSELRLLLTR